MIWADLYIIGFLISLLITHEFGHYWVAKRQGIYKHIGWIHFIGPCVEITRPYNSRWDYLSGILFSFLTLPMYLFGIYLGWMGNGQWYHFPFFAIGFGAWDIVLVYGMGKTFRMKKINWFFRFLDKIKLIKITEEDNDKGIQNK